MPPAKISNLKTWNNISSKHWENGCRLRFATAIATLIARLPLWLTYWRNKILIPG